MRLYLIMTDTEQSRKAKEFADKWTGRGYEKGDCQPFWLSLLRDVFGMENADELISFEEQVHLDHTSFMDAFIPTTNVLIEQKSLGKDLNKPMKQSDGSLLSPFQQAKRYITEFPLSKPPSGLSPAILRNFTSMIYLQYLCELLSFYLFQTRRIDFRHRPKNNDRTVMKLYGMSVKDTTEGSCVAALMQLYPQKIQAIAAAERKNGK